MLLTTSGDLASYHAALQLPIDIIRQYEDTIKRWLRCNGEQWTVDRCKTIYTDFVRYRAGEKPLGKYYAKNSEGLPSGFWSYLFRTSLTSKKKRFSCGVLLRAYTRFISHKPTDKQLSKFVSGVTAADIAIPSYITEGVVHCAHVLGKRAVKPVRPSFLSYTPSKSKRVPDCYGKTHNEETHWSFQWETIVNTNTGRYLHNKYTSIFSDVFRGMNMYTEGYPWVPDGNDTVGKIGLIQEPGYKLRAVANPNRVYQVALQPLGDSILRTLKDLPWDCTHDQSLGFPAIQQHLQQKKRVHCLDLTGATDYFPLRLQISLLRALFVGLDEDISLFEEISKSAWDFQDTTIRWTKGQPLGLYPSFGSFALTHGCLLFFLNNYSHNNDFFVLGDDVIILNDQLALRYVQALKELECPISEVKSVTSTIMAEFGGKLIFSDYIEPQLKWRQLSDDNFIDIVKLLGPRSLRLLRPQQRKVVKLIWDIPDFLGGLGFNPNGLPLSDRYAKYLELFGNDDGTFLTSFDRKFNSVFFKELEYPRRKISTFWSGSTLPDLDQRSAALVSKYLHLFIKMYGIMGTNLYSVVPNKDVLPIDGFSGSRRSLLTVLQRKLGIA